MINEEQAKDFQEEYLQLCKKHGLQLVYVPQWKQSQDTGTWSMILVPTLVQYVEGK